MVTDNIERAICDQQSDWILRLTPPLQVLVIRRYFTSGASFQDVLATGVLSIERYKPAPFVWSFPPDLELPINALGPSACSSRQAAAASTTRTHPYKQTATEKFFPAILISRRHRHYEKVTKMTTIVTST